AGRVAEDEQRRRPSGHPEHRRGDHVGPGDRPGVLAGALAEAEEHHNREDAEERGESGPRPGAHHGMWCLRVFRSRAGVVVVDVRQPGLSRMLGVMSDRQPGPAGHVHEHGHARTPGVTGRFRHALRPHSHDAADKVDAAMEASAEGIRALWISLAVLAGTALLQAVVVAVSGSVALLGDTLHNAADALTAVPLGIAFVVGKRPPTRRYTYRYGRAEDPARVVIGPVHAASP